MMQTVINWVAFSVTVVFFITTFIEEVQDGRRWAGTNWRNAYLVATAVFYLCVCSYVYKGIFYA